MGITFSAARAALKEDPALLNINKFWSYAALDAIGKTNFLPMRRNGTFTPSPHTQMQLHGFTTDKADGPHNFLPYVQAGWIVNTAPYKKS